MTLPRSIWLCPVHYEHFYLPENIPCPEDGCDEQLVEFVRVSASEDHILEVRRDGWSLEHPRRCRSLSLLDCPVQKAAAVSLVHGGGVPGRYIVKVADDKATKLAFLGVADA